MRGKVAAGRMRGEFPAVTLGKKAIESRLPLISRLRAAASPKGRNL